MVGFGDRNGESCFASVERKSQERWILSENVAILLRGSRLNLPITCASCGYTLVVDNFSAQLVNTTLTHALSHPHFVSHLRHTGDTKCVLKWKGCPLVFGPALSPLTLLGLALQYGQRDTRSLRNVLLKGGDLHRKSLRGRVNSCCSDVYAVVHTTPSKRNIVPYTTKILNSRTEHQINVWWSLPMVFFCNLRQFELHSTLH